MNRRQFLKSTTLISASAVLLPRTHFAASVGGDSPYQRLDHLYLSDFEAEQDEGPILLGNGRQTWLTTLRRKDFPASQEVISCFSLDGEAWKETNPVTAAGQYEAVAATCADGAEPIVVWTGIENHRWLIKAAIGTPANGPAQRGCAP